MKITIEINCDDDLQDVKTHLSVCRDQITKAIKMAETESCLNIIELSDNNCYGDHSIKIEFAK